MDRSAVSGIFAGHSAITVRLDTGELYTAALPPFENVQVYLEHRQAIGRPVVYEME
jgi:hypothetical protein